MNITQKQKGILFMILSALSFASMQVVVRMSREIPTMEQICVRNLHFTELSGHHSVLERPLSEVNGRLFFS